MPHLVGVNRMAQKKEIEALAGFSHLIQSGEDFIRIYGLTSAITRYEVSEEITSARESIIDGYGKYGLSMQWRTASYYTKKLQAIPEEKDSKNQKYYTEKSDCINVVPAF